MILRAALMLLYAAALVLGASAFFSPEPGATGAEAERVALDWVAAGEAQEPRRSGEEWEVDVVRPDGAVLGVERERGGGVEVAMRRPGGARVEVELDRRLRVVEVEPEQRGDE